jgi:hypothetical protein
MHTSRVPSAHTRARKANPELCVPYTDNEPDRLAVARPRPERAAHCLHAPEGGSDSTHASARGFYMQARPAWARLRIVCPSSWMVARADEGSIVGAALPWLVSPCGGRAQDADARRARNTADVASAATAGAAGGRPSRRWPPDASVAAASSASVSAFSVATRRSHARSLRACQSITPSTTWRIPRRRVT